MRVIITRNQPESVMRRYNG